MPVLLFFKKTRDMRNLLFICIIIHMFLKKTSTKKQLKNTELSRENECEKNLEMEPMYNFSAN